MSYLQNCCALAVSVAMYLCLPVSDALSEEVPVGSLDEVIGAWVHQPRPKEAVSRLAFSWASNVGTSTDFRVSDGITVVATRRTATIDVRPDGRVSMTMSHRIPQSDTCDLKYDLAIQGAASVADGKMLIDIEDGTETTSYSEACDPSWGGETSSLNGSKRVYEIWLYDGKEFKVRPYSPKGPIINALVFTR